MPFADSVRPAWARIASRRFPTSPGGHRRPSLRRRVHRGWRKLGLPVQFLLTAGLTLAFFALLDELLQARSVEQAFRETSTEIASAYINGIVSPHIHAPVEVVEHGTDRHAVLDKAITESGLKEEFERIKVWRPDGTIIFSTVDELVGRRFAVDDLTRAARGETVVAVSDPEREQDRLGARNPKPMLEVFVPIRDARGSVIAVGEVHKESTAIEQRQSDVVRLMWLIRSLSLFLGGATLYFLVKRAHATIVRQREQLQRQYRDASHMAQQNEVLRASANESRRRAAKANEELLSRVGAEIHDGPIQLLSIALLGLGRTDEAAPMVGCAPPGRPAPSKLMADVIDQLRTISTGLILPEIEDLLPEEALLLAITRHENMTGTTVDARISELPAHLSQGLKACMFRIVQECLNNSARHAGGQGQRVEASHDGRTITLVVSNGGSGGRSQTHSPGGRAGLGLLGARNRVEAFGGSIRTSETVSGGFVVLAKLPIDREEALLSPSIN